MSTTTPQQLQQARNAVLNELLGLHPLQSILSDISLRLESLQPQMRVSIMLLDGVQVPRARPSG